MAKLYGKEYTKDELRKKTGNLSQVCGINQYTFNSGWSDGVKAIDIDAGDLKFTIFPSRCLDIGKASFRGIPIGYISKSGLRSPSFFIENEARGFLDNFYGGLLTTCGLNNVGADNIVDGRAYGLHGEIANIPADQICIKEYWEGNDLIFEVSGLIQHSRFYAEDLVLRRSVKTCLGSNKILITDQVENRDFKRVPLFLLYHFNLGFPVLDAQSYLHIPGRLKTWARTESAEKGLDYFDHFQAPVDDIEEECFYHSFQDEKAYICLYNPDLGPKGMGVYLKYCTNELPVFLEWKMMRSREYVCGFCPSTTYLEGRKNALEKKEAIFIEPQETKRFEVEVGFIEGLNNIQ